MNQKRRTHAALVAAAERLLEKGRTPTVVEVADEALVSRATAYRYFPSQEHLLLGVVLERSIDELDDLVNEAAASSEQAEERVDAVARAVQAEIAANEASFRSLLALSLGQSPAEDGARIAAIRGERRVRWIEDALAPLRGRLGEKSLRRLVSALSLCLGAEAHFVLADVRSLENDEIADTLGWAARALVRAATDETLSGTRT